MNEMSDFPSTEATNSLWQRLYTDRVALMLLVGSALLLLLLWLLVVLSMSSLPDLLPLHFDVTGNPDRIGERGELYRLPMIASLIFGANVGAGLWLRLRDDRLFSPYLLCAGTLVIQLLFVIGTWNIIR